MKAEPRRTPPLGVKLAAALVQLEDAMRRLGMIPVECTVVDWDFDHTPALILRDVDPETGQHVPHQHDVKFLVWRPRTAHKVKTHGAGATTRGSDIGERDKTKRLVKAGIERGEIDPDDPDVAPWAPKRPGRPKPKKRWPKRSLPTGRQFQSRKPDRRPSA